MKDWIMELCPEIAEWQAELIAENIPNDTALLRQALEALEKPNAGLLPHNGEWRSIQSIAIDALRERLGETT